MPARPPRHPLRAHLAALLLALASAAGAQQTNDEIFVQSKGDGYIRPMMGPGWAVDTILNRGEENAGFPLIVPTERHLRHSVSDQFTWRGGQSCTALEVNVPLQEAFVFGGQSVYRINERLGVLLWLGDVNRPAVPLLGSGWQTVFDNFCIGNTRGYSVYAHPVILQAPEFFIRDIPFIAFEQKIAEVRLAHRSGPRLRGQTTFDIYLNTSFAVRARAVSCQVSLPRSVMLQTLRRTVFDSQTEILAGDMELRINCDPRQSATPAGFVMTDMTDYGNRGTIMKTTGTAQGLGLALYNEQGQPLRFGHSLSGYTNPWTNRGNSARFQVRYVKTGDRVRAGSLQGTVKFNIFYQ